MSQRRRGGTIPKEYAGVPYYTGYRGRRSSQNLSDEQRQARYEQQARYRQQPKLPSPCANIDFNECGNFGCKPVVRFRRTANDEPVPYCRAYPGTLTDPERWASTGWNIGGTDWYDQEEIPQNFAAQLKTARRNIPVDELHQLGYDASFRNIQRARAAQRGGKGPRGAQGGQGQGQGQRRAATIF